ncbi:MAG: DNA repair protein RecN [Chitinophagales bacterium]|nr:DNA repair protein RecN [Chitinophagales bacterium]MCZ2392284.1 DNA repair protein RecN [Chitinophagales bacterium]
MLQEIYIRNYAIIEKAQILFDPHLNVIIGETGAGKSILMGAVSLVLGNRADTQVLKDKEEKCIVEAHVNIKEYQLQDFFEEQDLDYSDICIIRREINPKGKSRAFINDIPVTLEVLKSLTSQLIDIHAQHENSQLMDEDFFIKLSDKITRNSDLVQYQIDFAKYIEAKKALKKFQEEALSFQKEYDFVKYQYDELDQILLSEDYWNEVEEEIKILSNAEAIIRQLQLSTELLSENEINIEDLLIEVQKQLLPVTHCNSMIESAYKDIDEIFLKLRSFARDFKQIQNNISTDENRLNELLEYQTAVNRLMLKHHFKDVKDLMALKIELQSKLEKFSFSDEKIQELQQEIQIHLVQLTLLGAQMSMMRKKQADVFCASISDVLKDLGMPFAKVNFQFEKLSEPNQLGWDKVIFLFAPNKGSQFQNLHQVGSGGEKSRLMLAIKSLVAKETSLPTMILDEIDTGTSGEVAIKTGELLKQISQQHQVITITHLPQVAAAGKKHFLVYKEHLDDKSITNIKTLDANETVLEIAKMLSGAIPTKAAIDNAKNLIGN